MADYSIEIAALEAILNSGASSVSTDGLSTSYDLESVRKRIAELKSQDQASINAGTTRPRLVRIRMPFN